MGMPDAVRVWTREEVLALPDDGQRYELVDGELLVSPSPRPAHQLAVTALLRRIDPYVREHRIGHVLSSPSDLDLGAGQLLQPDLFVVLPVAGRPLRDWADAGVPLLVIEVISPSTARFDRITKRRRYQLSGVPDYWVVDLDARLVEVWTAAAASPLIEDSDLVWRPDLAALPLVIDLPACFSEILGG
jgi:Uma2 family endonuclease